MNDIRNYKIKYVTEKEANEIYRDIHFCPAYYPLYDIGLKLIDGEMGCCTSNHTRYVMLKYDIVRLKERKRIMNETKEILKELKELKEKLEKLEEAKPYYPMPYYPNPYPNYPYPYYPRPHDVSPTYWYWTTC